MKNTKLSFILIALFALVFTLASCSNSTPTPPQQTSYLDDIPADLKNTTWKSEDIGDKYVFTENDIIYYANANDSTGISYNQSIYNDSSSWDDVEFYRYTVYKGFNASLRFYNDNDFKNNNKLKVDSWTDGIDEPTTLYYTKVTE